MMLIQFWKIERIDEISSCLENDTISWINIGGLGDVELLKELGILFRIHYFPLIENLWRLASSFKSVVSDKPKLHVP